MRIRSSTWAEPLIGALSVLVAIELVRSGELGDARTARDRAELRHEIRAAGVGGPDELAGALATVNDDLAAAVATFTARWYTDVTPESRRAMTFALLDLPASAIRRYLLAGRPPPTSLDTPTLAAARAAIAAV